MFSFSQLRLVVIPLLLLVSCSKDSEVDYGIAREPNSNIYNDLEVADSLKMNQIQYLSSHNSYRKHTDKKIYKFVRNFADILPYNLMEWEYNHVDIYTQLEKFGVRHLEIDIYGDK
ncbi:MAG TPA: Ca2+-dependent phosphoinositide-specific phospholipase C, partial [Chitinophagales bacterium]|nr:Ca2+-dependent phosphoinositide-specific phospholipase C [Chitinophagales bacterium]